MLGQIPDTDVITFSALMLQSSFDDGTDITKRAVILFGLPSYWPTNPPLQSKTIICLPRFDTPYPAFTPHAKINYTTQHLLELQFVVMALRNSISDEKDVEAIASHLDHANTTATNGGLSAEDMDFVANFPDEKKKKVLAKIDWRLMPMLAILYLVTYIDKANIGNAKIEGMLPDLGMSGEQYNIALSIYFIPYILAEIPSNMILNKFAKPSQYMATIMFIWGIVVVCTGLIHNFGQLCAIRILLGLFEAGFFPGAILIISKWYLPHETQTRVAILYTSAATGGAFSGLFAYAIAKMDGIGGQTGWRWIFFIEGIFTVVMSFVTWFLLIDSPTLSYWLTDEEKRYLVLRQASRRVTNAGEYREKTFDKGALFDVLKDWKAYLLVIMSWSNAAPNYGLKFSMPSIVKGMGYTSSNAQLMTIPPYLCGAISSYLLARFADKHKWRMPFIVGPQLCIIVAFSILMTKAEFIVQNLGVCYFAVCLACAGMYPILPGTSAWNIDNNLNPTKRAISIGFVTCAGTIGGIYGSYIYIDKEKPKYTTGYGASLGFAVAGILAAVTLETALIMINKKRSKISEADVRSKYTEEELEIMAGDNGDLRLADFVGDYIPPYTILSHTWGKDCDEVTFQDMVESKGKGKVGYEKLRFCEKQSANDNIKFFWVDTCCIDKTSSAELSGAINSMYHWYREAEKCYVYLSDVSINSSVENTESSQQTWVTAFRQSRWFTRGWTLQELVAPSWVEFFSLEGERLGDRESMIQELEEITGVNMQALQGSPLSRFALEERMSWARGRETKREEDAAYSLLGIFGVHMPLVYGEGRRNAFIRLQRVIEESSKNYGSGGFGLILQIGTALHETDDTFRCLMGDINRDGWPDLVAVKSSGTSSNNMEVNILSGASRFRTFITQAEIGLPGTAATKYDFALADWDGDKKLDLVVIKKSGTDSKTTEVSILSGASNFQDVILQTGTALEETDDAWTFTMGRWSAGRKPDLFAIKKYSTGTNSTEVHVLSGVSNFQKFILQTGTCLHETDAAFDFAVADWNADGCPDLVAVWKNSDVTGCALVHVLSGASTYQDFMLHAELPLRDTLGMYEFMVTEWRRNGKLDLHQNETAKLVQQHGAVPPPWFMFPGDHPYDIGWRMGAGESYIMMYSTWWEQQKERLDEKRRFQYFRKWPPPPEWLTWMIDAIWDLGPEDLKDDDYSPYFRRIEALGFGSEDDYKNAMRDEEE
ncbi:hypothetical protein FGADI_2113 [Fusarium gaditjirri]|uniref:Major facilitator superfamily (MFS) profile domain-containing protein n=1 Tax=Fusarium gaditjirri TaxID=282569 RepID=A0A8H4TJ57_9HYPO|nr:hypothetical protein FGADI_2113 [Fusarium gaditjirri]